MPAAEAVESNTEDMFEGKEGIDILTVGPESNEALKEVFAKSPNVEDGIDVVFIGDTVFDSDMLLVAVSLVSLTFSVIESLLFALVIVFNGKGVEGDVTICNPASDGSTLLVSAVMAGVLVYWAVAFSGKAVAYIVENLPVVVFNASGLMVVERVDCMAVETV